MLSFFAQLKKLNAKLKKYENYVKQFKIPLN